MNTVTTTTPAVESSSTTVSTVTPESAIRRYVDSRTSIPTREANVASSKAKVEEAHATLAAAKVALANATQALGTAKSELAASKQDLANAEMEQNNSARDLADAIAPNKRFVFQGRELTIRQRGELTYIVGFEKPAASNVFFIK